MIHLRIRTEYSFGETYAPIDRVIKRLKEIGCTAAGIVDNSTWGHVEWFYKCKETGILPLLGVECIVTDNEDETPLMWFIAKNTEGLSELYRSISKSYLNRVKTNRGMKNRLYKKDVLSLSDNIFKFAGDIYDGKFLKECKAIIDLNPSSIILNLKKKKLAATHGLMVMNTCDNAYAYPEDDGIFEIISKAGNKPSEQYITELEPQLNLIPKACQNLQLPKAPMVRSKGNLEKLCREGIKFRKMKWNKEYEERLMYELELIRSKDYESYFLIVADMVQYAKDHMLVGPSRGSAAGSLVCYLSRITEIDPIPPGLFFERFIAINRIDLPDIDLDFPDIKRHLVFEYMAKKYGESNVAHIGTISRFKPRSALIQVCKALDIPPTATGAVKVAMIDRSSADARASNCLEDTFKDTQPGRDFIKMYPEAECAMFLEGHASHTGVHAAGLLVCNNDISNYAVVDNYGIAHIEKGAAEKLGLLKIDVLGLRTLGILEDSGININWYNLTFNDQNTLEIYNNEKLCGIFQFEGQAMRSIAGSIKFKGINEIDAVTALARPGPFAGGVTQKYIERSKGKPYESIHPLVEKYMSDTYGLPIYQEQTLAIVRNIGKFDWDTTSIIRKAMSKSLGEEFFNKYWPKFKEGATSQGIPVNEARKTWNMINSMGSWQMNKAHTYSYAVISYWTAYLKAHYPLEFAAANLRNTHDEDKSIELLREFSREGYEYIPFDINLSESNWSVKDGKLYGGFMSLKGIGESKAAKYVEKRNAGKLTKKDYDDINVKENVFADIFPFHNRYAHLYDEPSKNGIADDVVDISSLDPPPPHRHERVFLGELIHKNSRNMNEAILIKKRGGKVENHHLDYVELRLRDDTGSIGGRIGRYDFERIGKDLLENVPVGAHLMVRAKFFNNIRYAFISKWKMLNA